MLDDLASRLSQAAAGTFPAPSDDAGASQTTPPADDLASRLGQTAAGKLPPSPPPPPRPPAPSLGEAAESGAVTGGAHVLGMPVDVPISFANAVLNNIRNSYNELHQLYGYATGSASEEEYAQRVKYIAQHPLIQWGMGQTIEKGLAAAGAPTASTVHPTDPLGRIVQRGTELGTELATPGGIAKLAEIPRLATGLRTVGDALDLSRPVGFQPRIPLADTRPTLGQTAQALVQPGVAPGSPLVNVGIGAASAVGGETLADTAGERWRPVGELLGGIGGGTAVGAAEKYFPMGADLEARARQEAEQHLGRRVGDDPAATEALLRQRTAAGPLVPGSTPTTGELVGETPAGGNILAEQRVRERESDSLNQQIRAQRAAQNTARFDALEGLAPGTAGATDVQSAVRTELDSIDQQRKDALTQAEQAAEQARTATQPTTFLTPEDAGATARSAIEAERDPVKQQMQTDLAQATQDAQDALARAGGETPVGTTFEEQRGTIGAAIRDPLQASSDAERDRLNAMRAAIDPDNRMHISADPIHDAVKAVQADTPFGDLTGSEKELHKRITEWDQWGDQVPFNDVTQLRVSINDRLRDFWGRDPSASRRLMILKNGVDKALDDAVAGANAATGAVSPTGPIPLTAAAGAAFTNWNREYSEYARTFRGETPGKLHTVGQILQPGGAWDSYHWRDDQIPMELVKDNTPVQAIQRVLDIEPGTRAALGEAFAFSLRDAAMKADGTLDPAKYRAWLTKPRLDKLSMFPDLLDQFNNVANAQTRVDAVTKSLLDHETSYPLKPGLDNALVLPQYWKGGVGSAPGMRQYLEHTGGSEGAINAALDYAAYDFGNAAITNGEINVNAANRWLSQHKAGVAELDRAAQAQGLPGIADRFDNAISAQQTVEAIRDRKLTDREKYTQSVAQAFIQADPNEAISRIFSGKDRAQKATTLMQLTSTYPAAQEGVQRAAINFIKRQISGVPAAGAEGSLLKAQEFRKFLSDNQDVLETLFPGRAQLFKAIGEDVERGQRINTAVLPGSQTFELWSKRNRTEAPSAATVGRRIAYDAVGGALGSAALGSLLPIFGHLGGFAIGTLGREMLQWGKTRINTRADHLFDEMLLRPENAADALKAYQALQNQLDQYGITRTRGGLFFNREGHPITPAPIAGIFARRLAAQALQTSRNEDLDQQSKAVNKKALANRTYRTSTLTLAPGQMSEGGPVRRQEGGPVDPAIADVPPTPPPPVAEGDWRRPEWTRPATLAELQTPGRDAVADPMGTMGTPHADPTGLVSTGKAILDLPAAQADYFAHIKEMEDRGASPEEIAQAKTKNPAGNLLMGTVLGQVAGKAIGTAGKLAADVAPVGEFIRDESGALRLPPGKLSGPKESDPGYVYHATNADNLRDIQTSGKLNTYRPEHGTDQESWPDGSQERRNYFTPTAENTWQFAPEQGDPALLRLKRENHPIKQERGTGDLYSTKPVPIQHLEYLGDDGAWQPLAEPAEAAQPPTHIPPSPGGATLTPEYPAGRPSPVASLAEQLRNEHLAREDAIPLTGKTQPVTPPRHIQTNEDFDNQVNHYVDLALQGSPWRDWYTRSGQAILSATGDSPEAANALVAAAARTSPRTDVASNMRAAITAHNQAMLGDPIRAGRFPNDMGRAIERYYYGGERVSGEKINPFMGGVAEEWNPDFAHTFVNDTWNMRASGYTGPNGEPWGTPGVPGIRTITSGYHNFARILAQRASDELERRTGMSWSPKQTQAAAWIAEKAAGDGVPLEVAARDFADGLAANYAQLSWEAAPGLTTNHLPEFHTAEPEVRQAYHNAIRNVLIDDKGRDIIAQHLGLLTGPSFDAPGVFRGQVSPGTQSLVALGQAPGGWTAGLDPASKALADTTELVRGLLLRQDAVAYHKPMYIGGPALETPKGRPLANLADVDIGRMLTHEEAGNIAQSMNDIATRAGAKDPTFFSPIATPTGYRFLNVPEVTGLSNTRFQNLARDLLKTDIHPDAHVKGAHAESGYFDNNWQENPNGQDFIRHLRGTGRPDLQRAAAELLATLGTRISEIEEDFARNHGWTPNRATRIWETHPDLVQGYGQVAVPSPPRPWRGRTSPPATGPPPDPFAGYRRGGMVAPL